MSLHDYIAKHRIIILKSKTKKGAFSELVRAVSRELPQISRDALLRAIWERESLLTTRITPDIAIPHAQIEGLEKSLIVVGKSREGISYDPIEDGRVHLIFLILGGPKEHLKALADVASFLQNKAYCESCLKAWDRDRIYALLSHHIATRKPALESSPVTEAVCDNAVDLAVRIGATAVIIHDPSPALQAKLVNLAAGPRFVFTSDESPAPIAETSSVQVLQVPFRGMSRSNQLELSLLLALSKGIIQKGERVVSVLGMAGDSLDTIVVADVNREFSLFFAIPDEAHTEDIEQQVFIRALQLATEIAEEGREGKPVGTLFVIGDLTKVTEHCCQMVINPFKGYAPHERNILDPSLAETVKEFAHIDGAFVVSGDGVIATAGAYLRVDHPIHNLPSGLGARHTAAAAITAVTKAVAIAISESTRRVTLFRAGQRVIEI